MELMMTHSHSTLETGVIDLLSRLEERSSALRLELSQVEAELRVVRTTEQLCGLCGGTGGRIIRGGMYGERLATRCECDRKDR